ncbi:alpha/beta hydrolase [Sagittula sp. P11]|uniref:alpha/beta hydrolase n=1 Tax=unclassified Sagittula TaxID=2624628 RepID=UPI000C2D3946|nr:alpha/beta hydrolase [Sagittula sp. P11]AUC53687.1 alpha/beta hydrolase [Sagittula sp. P11]
MDQKTDLSDAYENGAYIPDGASYPPRWAAEAQAYRKRLSPAQKAVLGLPYGEGARHRMDLFLPDRTPEGLVVFVHGGYWQRFDRSDWSHLAEGARARGWAVAMPSYDLCPSVRIRDITAQVVQAVTIAAEEVQGPIRLTGHSAGGHLAARMGTGVLPEDVAARVQAILPISPLSDLRPLMETAMNANLKLDSEEARAESPIFHSAPRAKVTVWVGGAERPAFLEQAEWLEEAWGCSRVVDEGKHHFDVIDSLADPSGALTERLLSM